MTKFLVLLCVFVVAISVESYLFSFDCPTGCADRTCTSMGCVTCSPGYCAYFRRGMGICLQKCPKEYGCYRGLLSVCTKCNIPHCEECTVLGSRGSRLCTKCEYRYTLSSDGRRCDRRRG